MPRQRKWYSPVVEAALEALEARVLLTPALSSLPGANHTILLDFDGHTTVGTSYNNTYNQGQPIVSPSNGYDDATIISIWTRVAEDFAPFNVNVTTVEPPLADLLKDNTGFDTKWGVRAIQTWDQSWLSDNVGYAVGGIGFTNAFNIVETSDTPVFSFNQGEYYSGETLSHEIGHSLGLGHSGTGDIIPPGQVINYNPYHGGELGVAPIMGLGWGQPISRWVKHEYPRSIGNQDQLAVIVTRNGFGYRQDNNDMRFLVEGTPVSGIIETNEDSDSFWFTIDTHSSVTLALTKVLGTNLTELVRVYKDGGERVTDLTVLGPGTYYVTIDGVAGDYYSDYGSLGQYTISIDVTTIETPPQVVKVEVNWASTWVEATRIISWEISAVRLTWDNGQVEIRQLDSPVNRGSFLVEGYLVEVLLGDVNGDRRVNLIDALYQRGRNGTSNPWADTDGDGFVDLEDALLLRGLNGNTL